MTFASEARNAEVISDHILGSSRWCHPEPAAQRLFSPKGWDKSAQGNAGGRGTSTIPNPERARQGFSWCARGCCALSGLVCRSRFSVPRALPWADLSRPLRGGCQGPFGLRTPSIGGWCAVAGFRSPGRCPRCTTHVKDPSGLVPLVSKVGWLRQESAKTTDPHVLVTWVKKIGGHAQAGESHSPSGRAGRGLDAHPFRW